MFCVVTKFETMVRKEAEDQIAARTVELRDRILELEEQLDQERRR